MCVCIISFFILNVILMTKSKSIDLCQVGNICYCIELRMQIFVAFLIKITKNIGNFI